MHVRAATTAVHVLVNLCGMEEGPLSACLAVISETFMALSYLRHSSVVASINPLGVSMRLRRPVCSISGLQAQIESCRIPSRSSALDHRQGRCSCVQDFQSAIGVFKETTSQVLVLTSPLHLPPTQLLTRMSPTTACSLQFILLRREDEDIQATTSAIMALVEAIASVPCVSVVQAEDNLMELRRIMVMLPTSLQGHICRRNHGCDAFKPMHAGLAKLTALHYVPTASIDGSVVIGFPLTADVSLPPLENAVVGAGMLRHLQSTSTALRQSEYFAMVPASPSPSQHYSFVLYRLASIDQLTISSADDSACEAPVLDPTQVDAMATTLSSLVPTQPYNPYNYASGATPPRPQLPPAPSSRRML
ncbi:hypothetical protein ACHHYP_07284 [Achlya hypogyna]|uniref:Uncharacterized protein n=1 Tax=Achlya hypogyna TaxID=1202772 RepID=A0A1V9YR84_ACHHY|nr:hypothetical protein ACHHYP_07284 [Achlya hypogyna]